jgi:hypothetical protein
MAANFLVNQQKFISKGMPERASLLTSRNFFYIIAK